jgi:membrane protein insertase Oxa1/YidC/SpoIIIJ
MVSVAEVPTSNVADKSCRLTHPIPSNWWYCLFCLSTHCHLPRDTWHTIRQVAFCWDYFDQQVLYSSFSTRSSVVLSFIKLSSTKIWRLLPQFSYGSWASTYPHLELLECSFSWWLPLFFGGLSLLFWLLHWFNWCCYFYLSIIIWMEFFCFEFHHLNVLLI